MNCKKVLGIGAIMLTGMTTALHADEGMWLLQELNQQNRARMAELGLNVSTDKIYNQSGAALYNAVVIFGGGCTGISVSDKGLIFTNHHCGYSSIQKLSSVEHNYLRDGFVSNNDGEELPVDGLQVKYVRETVDVSDRINSYVSHISDEYRRIFAADSIGKVICDSIGDNEFTDARVIPFYNHNKYYLVVYDVYRDVRLVFTPPSSMGRFGGDTDNWMWPRQTIDFSVFRVYANGENKPAAYSKDNRPYQPKYHAEVSMQGYKDKDFAMTIGFPGGTDRYLSSWGIEEMVESSNKPRILIRGIKQDIWKKAMLKDEAVQIKYANKYAGSSNYWKNSIGMNRGVSKLDVIGRKQSEELAFSKWVAQNEQRKEKYGEVLDLLRKSYTASSPYYKALTYLNESFLNGAEIIRFAGRINGFDTDSATTEERDAFMEETVKPFFKDYEPALDQELFAAMLKVYKENVDPQYLPIVYKNIDKKYKGDYQRYAADFFKQTNLTDYNSVADLIYNPKVYAKKWRKDPAAAFNLSVMITLMDLRQSMSETEFEAAKGERLYMEALQEMYPDSTFYSDANFTMRLSYGSVGGYRPQDAVWYNYYTTQNGILEKADSTNEEFNVEPKLIDMFSKGDFGTYGNADRDLQVCFLTNNDITGGNSGSPVFDKNTRLIGLAFDGNWEAMSGDIVFEKKLQRCIVVDIRAVLYMIDRWGNCSRLIKELDLK